MEAKVPFYNIVNIFLPGLVLLGSCVLLFLDKVKTLMQAVTNLGSAGLEVLVTVSLFAIAYEVGYIIFRLGAVTIERIFKKFNRYFIWTDYRKFVAAKKIGADKLEDLSREYSFARTQISLFIILAVVSGIKFQWWLLGVCVACIILFTLAIREHMKKIATIVQEYLGVSENEAEND